MAPRKQTKAAGSVVADVNGDASRPKRPRKRRIAVAAKPVVEESKRTGLRRRKAEKAEVSENEMVTIDASPPKKTRGGGGKSKTAEPKSAAETKSGRSNKVTKAEEAMNNNANEKKQTTEKRARATKTVVAMAKKAGTKEQAAAKSKAKESAKKSRNNVASTENGASGDAAEVGAVAMPTKRTRGKVVEKENAMPAARTVSVARAPKKRKNAEDNLLTAAGDAEVAEEEAARAVPDKKPRAKPKKAGAQAANEQVKSKGRAKKNTAKVEAAKSPSKETEEEEQNAQDAIGEQENSTKAESTKNTKKRNAKKPAPKEKRNTAPEKVDDAQAEDAAKTEADVQENGKIENVQSKQQKKRNTNKANAAMKEKTEAKGRQKKGQITAIPAVDGEIVAKDVSAEDDTAEKMKKQASEAQGENDTNEVAQSDNALNKKEEKGENNEAALPESVENTQLIKNELLEVDTSIDEN